MNSSMTTDWDSPKVFVTSINKSVSYQDFVAKLFKIDTSDMEHLHAALGVCGEAGELADAIKKHVVYGKPLDRANIVEELGDLRFYMQQIMNMHGIGEIELLQGNADKLAKRYPSGEFKAEDAIARADKVAEDSNAYSSVPEKQLPWGLNHGQLGNDG